MVYLSMQKNRSIETPNWKCNFRYFLFYCTPLKKPRFGRYQADPNVKMIVLLGEVGGVEEYEVCHALQTKKITKPLVAWCIGTCAGMFTAEVQFGHAGSCANSNRETATAKNESLKDAGAHVPESFDYLGKFTRGVRITKCTFRPFLLQAI